MPFQAFEVEPAGVAGAVEILVLRRASYVTGARISGEPCPPLLVQMAEPSPAPRWSRAGAAPAAGPD